MSVELEELPEDIEAIRRQVHEFAEREVRPASIKLDRMDPADVPREGSPYWKIFGMMHKMGYHRALVPEEHGGLELPPLACYTILEELAWGSLGIATALGVDWIPLVSTSLVARLTSSETLVEEIVRPWLKDEVGRYHGCWAITEPEHGSDTCLAVHSDSSERYGKGQTIAEKDGDEWVLNGAKSSWPSSSAAATHALVHVWFPPEADMGKGGVCIVPLNIDGVTRGTPIDKLGFRDNPQAEIVFENVRIPEDYMFVQVDFYPVFAGVLVSFVSSTSCGMNAFGTGLARAAFEEALNYARERVQGGVKLVEMPSIKLELYRMYEKLISSKVYGRKLADIVWGNLYKLDLDMPISAAFASQVMGKRHAFEVANSALQVHGGYGLTKEFLIEKLFRDSREIIVEDYTLDALSLASIEELLKMLF
jgi:alkylation response protein AidB-like acyl-CoA dehydrogenase